MTTETVEITLADDEATVALGRRLAELVAPPLLVFLEGDLGAGKTTLSRGLLQGLGHRGAVKSPTYTLVEPYSLPAFPAYHFDLYRLSDPEELEYLGFRDYLEADALVLVEWPSRGRGLLPSPDLQIELRVAGDGRVARLSAHSPGALRIIAAMQTANGRA